MTERRTRTYRNVEIRLINRIDRERPKPTRLQKAKAELARLGLK